MTDITFTIGLAFSTRAKSKTAGGRGYDETKATWQGFPRCGCYPWKMLVAVGARRVLRSMHLTTRNCS